MSIFSLKFTVLLITIRLWTDCFSLLALDKHFGENNNHILILIQKREWETLVLIQHSRKDKEPVRQLEFKWWSFIKVHQEVFAASGYAEWSCGFKSATQNSPWMAIKFTHICSWVPPAQDSSSNKDNRYASMHR